MPPRHLTWNLAGGRQDYHTINLRRVRYVALANVPTFDHSSSVLLLRDPFIATLTRALVLNGPEPVRSICTLSWPLRNLKASLPSRLLSFVRKAKAYPIRLSRKFQDPILPLLSAQAQFTSLTDLTLCSMNPSLDDNFARLLNGIWMNHGTRLTKATTFFFTSQMCCSQPNQ